MTVRIHTTTIESAHPARLAAFWCGMLGYVIEPNHTTSVQIGPPEGGPSLLFAPSTRPKEHRNRFHFDLRPDEQEVAVAQALALGASILPSEEVTSWVRMADPEGNEFCILQSQADYDAFLASGGA